MMESFPQRTKEHLDLTVVRSKATINDLEYAKSILESEAKAISNITLDDSFIDAVRLCRCTQAGCVIVSGAGKSGIAAQKISATFSSVDIPSWFLHAGEAAHGDIGRIRPEDTIIFISNSGETSEVIRLVSTLNNRHLKSRIIAITSTKESSLGQRAGIVITTGHVMEAGSTKLVPTSSIAAVVALGDALALTVAGRHFTAGSYWRNHPGGNIGKRFSKVNDLMRIGADCPILSCDSTIKDVIVHITESRAGAAILTSIDGKIGGIFTDGDLRRFLATGKSLETLVSEYMIRKPLFVEDGSLVEYALDLFRTYTIGDLPVLDSDQKPIGMLSLKDISHIALR